MVTFAAPACKVVGDVVTIHLVLCETEDDFSVKAHLAPPLASHHRRV